MLATKDLPSNKGGKPIDITGATSCPLHLHEAVFLYASTECRGQYDLTFVLENSDDVGPENFEKMKIFARDLVNAFIIGSFGSRVALVTYGGPASVEFKFNSIPGATKKMIFKAIDQVRFQSGPGGALSAGLQKAVDSVYTIAGGVRERSNKVRN